MWKTIINPAPWPLLASKKTYNLQTFFIQAYSHLCFLFTTFINCCWNPVIRGRFWVLWFVLNQFFTFFKTFFPVSDREMPTNWFLNIKEIWPGARFSKAPRIKLGFWKAGPDIKWQGPVNKRYLRTSITAPISIVPLYYTEMTSPTWDF